MVHSRIIMHVLVKLMSGAGAQVDSFNKDLSGSFDRLDLLNK